MSWLSLACGACGGEEAGAPAPTPISPAEAEAELAARSARAFEPEPSKPEVSARPAEQHEQVLTVSARVLDPEARALEGATLDWLVASPSALLPEVRATARADSNGATWLRIAWNELDSTQPLTLALHAAGHLRYRLVFEPERWMAGPVFNLGEVVLPPGGALSGRVLDASGAGQAGVVVGLSAELGAEASALVREMARVWPRFEPIGAAGVEPLVLTRPDGSFLLDGVPEGRFDVVAAAFGERSALLPDRAAGIEVRVRETTAVSDLVLRPASESELIRGRVLAPDETPLAGIWIALAYADGKEIYAGRTYTGADGRFALPAMLDTVYWVLANDVAGRWPQAGLRDVRPGGAEIVVRFAP